MDYHQDISHISKSGLDQIRKSPAKYYARYLDPKKPKDDAEKSAALKFGGAYHSRILEPDEFNNEYFIMPNFSGDGSRSARSELINTNHGKEWISRKDFDKIEAMRAVLENHPVASQMLSSPGYIEQRFNWIDPSTGVKCKIKPDKYLINQAYVMDLKTIDDASERGVSSSSAKYRYHVQGAFYTDGMIANGIHPKGFIFVFQEKDYPYLVNVKILKPADIELGRDVYMEDLKTYAECNRSGAWPGYSEIITHLDLPAWMYK